MLSLSEQEEPVYELLSVWLRLVSTQLVFQNFSQPDPIRSQHKEESMPRWVTCTKTIGDGTCTTQSRAQIGLEIRMLSIT
jgi:hypothetical protein